MIALPPPLRLILALAFATFLAPGSALAQAEAAAPVSLETLKEVTRTLSSDEFEGRAPGTPGEARTLAYLVERFAAAGLEPGNHGSWFQDVPLVEIAGSGHAPLSVAGGNAPLSFAFGDE